MRKSDRLSPKARKERLVIKELANETLVYDEINHKAHCLNSTAGRVWKFCLFRRRWLLRLVVAGPQANPAPARALGIAAPGQGLACQGVGPTCQVT